MSFTYWRLRICVDTRKVLSRSPVDDLAEVLMMEQFAVGVVDQRQFERMLGEEKVKLKCEEELSRLLDITKERLGKALRWWD